MKIKSFNRKTIKRSDPPFPAITVNIGGRMSISHSLANILGLMGNKKIIGLEFFQDEENEEDFYIFPSEDKNSFRLRLLEGKYIVQNSGTAQSIHLVCNIKSRTIRCMVNKIPQNINGKECFLIITKSATEFIRKTKKDKK